MEQSRTTASDVLSEIPAKSAQVHPESPVRRSLAQSLGPAVDRIRQLATDLGVRPYQVWLVHWRWPGKRGLGKPIEIHREEILPTPRVQDMLSTSFAVSAFGMSEGGGLFIDQVSQRYSEADLTGRTPDLIDPARTQTSSGNVEFFWEVRERRQTTPPTKPRRYVPSGVPMLNRTGMHWRVNLTKQETSYEVEAEAAS
jgi:hypothetical protein